MYTLVPDAVTIPERGIRRDRKDLTVIDAARNLGQEQRGTVASDVRTPIVNHPSILDLFPLGPHVSNELNVVRMCEFNAICIFAYGGIERGHHKLRIPNGGGCPAGEKKYVWGLVKST